MAIPLRGDFDAVHLRVAARRTKNAAQARRLLSLAAVYDCATRAEVARIDGVTLQIVRSWVLKFSSAAPPGLIDLKAPGQPSRLPDAHPLALVAVLESSPMPAAHCVVLPAILDEIAREKGVEPSGLEIWFAHEPRVGQKNKITRRWARRGTLPSAPHDQRTASTYTSGAICPRKGKGAALVPPHCNTEAMNLHLAEITAAVLLEHFRFTRTHSLSW